MKKIKFLYNEKYIKWYKLYYFVTRFGMSNELPHNYDSMRNATYVFLYGLSQILVVATLDMVEEKNSWMFVYVCDPCMYVPGILWPFSYHKNAIWYNYYGITSHLSLVWFKWWSLKLFTSGMCYFNINNQIGQLIFACLYLFIVG